jgi:hypothetical protein
MYRLTLAQQKPKKKKKKKKNRLAATMPYTAANRLI